MEWFGVSFTTRFLFLFSFFFTTWAKVATIIPFLFRRFNIRLDGLNMPKVLGA